MGVGGVGGGGGINPYFGANQLTKNQKTVKDDITKINNLSKDSAHIDAIVKLINAVHDILNANPKDFPGQADNITKLNSYIYGHGLPKNYNIWHNQDKISDVLHKIYNSLPPG